MPRPPPVPQDTSSPPVPRDTSSPLTGPPRTPPTAGPLRASPRRGRARAPALLLAWLAACAAQPVPEASFQRTPPVPEAEPPRPPESTATAPVLTDSSPTAAPPAARPPPPGLVDLRAALPGACFDIRYHTADNFTGAPLPGYGAPGAWLRERPAAALARAQAALAPRDLVLLIHDAYRPIRASLAMVAWAERTGRRDLVDDGYIARRSGHNRGDTIDVTLARKDTCTALDMGTAWDHLGPESHTTNATGEPRRNRLLLRDALVAVGFTPYPKEWWHFTFDDPGATPLDLPYGAADPP